MHASDLAAVSAAGDSNMACAEPDRVLTRVEVRYKRSYRPHETSARGHCMPGEHAAHGCLFNSSICSDTHAATSGHADSSAQHKIHVWLEKQDMSCLDRHTQYARVVVHMCLCAPLCSVHPHRDDRALIPISAPFAFADRGHVDITLKDIGMYRRHDQVGLAHWHNTMLQNCPETL